MLTCLIGKEFAVTLWRSTDPTLGAPEHLVLLLENGAGWSSQH